MYPRVDERELPEPFSFAGDLTRARKKAFCLCRSQALWMRPVWNAIRMEGRSDSGNFHHLSSCLRRPLIWGRTSYAPHEQGKGAPCTRESFVIFPSLESVEVVVEWRLSPALFSHCPYDITRAIFSFVSATYKHDYWCSSFHFVAPLEFERVVYTLITPLFLPQQQPYCLQ